MNNSSIISEAFNQIRKMPRMKDSIKKSLKESRTFSKKDFNDLIDRKSGELLDTMRLADEFAYRYPRFEYRVYIDSDGNVDYDECEPGYVSSSRYNDPDYRQFYIATFHHPNVSLFKDYLFRTSEDFVDTFEDDFGLELQDTGDIDELVNIAREVAKEDGVPEKVYNDWLEELDAETAEELTYEADRNGYYEKLLNDYLNKTVTKNYLMGT